MRIGIIDCGIENQNELFRADLPLHASYSLLQSIFNECLIRNKIFRISLFFSEKNRNARNDFPEKIGPGVGGKCVRGGHIFLGNSVLPDRIYCSS